MQSIGNIQKLWKFLPQILILLTFVSPVLSGFACLSNPCIHGVCLDDLNTTYSCYCIDGYTGIQCQTNWDECWSNPCQNGGICHDGIASFNCTCPPGFVGDMCEEDYNECESNPCLNNGTCLDVTNAYVCNCIPGYSGVHCELDVAVCNATNETRCANGGICIDGPGVTFECKCQSGWTGFLCDVEIDECMSSPCQNGAVCIDLHAGYSCACLFGFTGQNCDEIVMVCEDNPCKNDALCLMEENYPVCYCVPDFHGNFCQFQYDECQLGPRCMNGGTCIDGVDNFTCSCPPNLTGVLCECLIKDDDNLDCTYVSPKSTTSSTSKITTTPFVDLTTEIKSTTVFERTETTSVQPTISYFFTQKTPETISYVPNISTTLLPEPSTTFSSYETETEFPITKISTNLFNITTPTTASESTTSESTSISTTVISTIVETTTKPSIPTAKEIEIYSTTWDSTLETTTKTLFEVSTDRYTTERLSTEFNFTTTEKIDFTTLEETISVTNPTTVKEFFTEPEFFSTTSISEGTTQKLSTVYEEKFSTTELVPTKISTAYSTPWDQYPSTFSTESIENLTTTLFSTLFTEQFTSSLSPSTFDTYSTTVESLTTPVTYPDCTKQEFHCRNGGTCVYTTDGYKCACTFDADGTLCENLLGIRNAAFGGDSFLSHRIINKTSISIEFKAKTLSSSGIIFYSNIDNTYMSLYLQNGYLKFKFSCGFQTMLLSELKVPVNNGYLMNIKAELKFSSDLKHCFAIINLNNTLSMSGDQIALVDKFSKTPSWLHLGGVPLDNVKDTLPVSGFIGCMKDLKISGKKVKIFKDAEDGFEIVECSSLACLSNPCLNGGTCTGNSDTWSCRCKNGYSGSSCELSVCQNNPCQFGGTCVPFTGSGYICLCPYGKHGHFCENDMEITEPYFSSTIHGLSSFAAYPIPPGIVNKMELKFKFTPATMDQIAILAFIGQKGPHNSKSDHIAVSFVKGYIMLTWNLGTGPRRIFTTKPVDKGNGHLVHIGRSGRRAWLYVENLGNVTGRSPGNLVNLNVIPIIYFGGHDSLNFTNLPHDLPLHSGFSGCIFDVEVKSDNVVIPLQGSKHTIGRAIGQCGTTECYDKICRNGGACLYHGGTFTCLCQDGWYGPLCSSRRNPCDTNVNQCASGSTCVPLIGEYECDCPLGKTGKFCEKDEKLSDVSFSGTRSFISLDPINFDPSKFNIDLEIRPLSDKGLILFIGQKEKSFLSLSIQSSLLEVRILPGRHKQMYNEVVSIRSNKILGKGVWHKIRIGKYGRKIYLFVDNVINTGLLKSGDTMLISEDEIYLGGVSDMSTLPYDAMSILPTHFKGCIRKFTIDFKHIALTARNIKNSRNIGDCDGTPCGGEYCENGGTCWIDPHFKPHCTCNEPYFGERCEMLPSCEKVSCRNNGKCINMRCSCTVGWTGAFCEKSIIVKVPKFFGNSYIVIKKFNDKKREAIKTFIKTLYLNFTTANQDGLILWTQKDKNFLSVGVENGFLILIYSMGKLNKHIELPSSGYISDGLWHTLEISLHPIIFMVDKNILYIQKDYENIHDTYTNGIFYLGGLPKNSTIFKEITTIHHKNFEGCIETFGTNSNNLITDFSKFEGENIGICNEVL